MPFYLDENVSNVVAVLCRAMGLDVVSSHELGRDGMSDELQMAFAVSQRRCMVTFDRVDYQRLAREYEARGEEYFGILLLSPAFESGPAGYAPLARALKAYSELFPGDIHHTDWLHPTA